MLRINPNSIANSCDSRIIIDLETMCATEEMIEYHKEQISKSINDYLFKQFTDMCVQIDSRPKNLSLTDTVEFDRYAFLSYVSINYKDNKTPLIPIVL
jgi:hypothetical protein